MAIANATCKCATCGKEFVIRANKRNTEIARNFEQWAVANITECDECRHERETAASAAAYRLHAGADRFQKADQLGNQHPR